MIALLFDKNFRGAGDSFQEKHVSLFGRCPSGEQVELVTIEAGGTKASIMSWGASLQDMRREKIDHSLVLGSGDFDAYLGPMKYFGAIVGPLANRVSNAKFGIEDRRYVLDRNENNKTCLHGGSEGSGERNWKFLFCDENSCILELVYADGQGGFPGPITVQAQYSIDVVGALNLEILAKSAQTTHLNFAHHSYWNLDGSADISGHRLCVNAEKYLPVDEDLIPLGEPELVIDTPFDFRKSKSMSSSVQNALIDHNFCIEAGGDEMRHACVLQADGLRMNISSTEPGLQIFDATGINTAPFCGHNGLPYSSNAGLALEPQKWPDAPNQPSFPTTLVQAGDIYRQFTKFEFEPA